MTKVRFTHAFENTLGLTPDWELSSIGHENPNDIHTVPCWGLPHAESSKCWCEPVCTYSDPETGRSCWLHKSPDDFH